MCSNIFLGKRRILKCHCLLQPLVLCALPFSPAGTWRAGQRHGTLHVQLLTELACSSSCGQPVLKLWLLAPCPTRLLPPSLPLTCSPPGVLASVLFLEHTEQTPDSRSLLMLFPLPATLFLLIFLLLAPSPLHPPSQIPAEMLAPQRGLSKPLWENHILSGQPHPLVFLVLIIR